MRICKTRFLEFMENTKVREEVMEFQKFKRLLNLNILFKGGSSDSDPEIQQQQQLVTDEAAVASWDSLKEVCVFNLQVIWQYSGSSKTFAPSQGHISRDTFDTLPYANF